MPTPRKTSPQNSGTDTSPKPSRISFRTNKNTAQIVAEIDGMVGEGNRSRVINHLLFKHAPGVLALIKEGKLAFQ